MMELILEKKSAIICEQANKQILIIIPHLARNSGKDIPPQLDRGEKKMKKVTRVGRVTRTTKLIFLTLCSYQLGQ